MENIHSALVFEQLQELQDLSTFPVKYIDALKKNHVPVYGYKK